MRVSVGEMVAVGGAVVGEMVGVIVGDAVGATVGERVGVGVGQSAPAQAIALALGAAVASGAPPEPNDSTTTVSDMPRLVTSTLPCGSSARAPRASRPVS